MRITAKTVLLNGNWMSEIKPNRISNPKGYVTTSKIQDIILNPDTELVAQYNKEAKLIYDKKNVHFNVNSGKYLFFAEDGACYILTKINE